MRLQRIIIDKQMAQVGINHAPARLQINSPSPNFELNQSRSQLEINRRDASFTYDRQRLDNERGLASIRDVSRNFAGEGRQAAMRATARYSQEGDRQAKVPGDQIPGISRSRSMSRLGPREINIGLMPRSPPNLNWDTGGVDINFTRHNISVSSSGINMAEIPTDPRVAVTTYIETRPYIHISVVDSLA